jgi:hypothetical protein
LNAYQTCEGHVPNANGAKCVEEILLGGVAVVEAGDYPTHEDADKVDFVGEVERFFFVNVIDFLGGEGAGVEAVFDGVAVAIGGTAFAR